MSNLVNVGDEVKCSITGFKGIAMGRTEYLFGCVRVGILPTKVKDKKDIDYVWFDETQLVVIKKQKIQPSKEVKEKIKLGISTGGPGRESSSMNRLDSKK